MIASQAVHLTTGSLAVLQQMNTEFKKKQKTNRQMCDTTSVCVFQVSSKFMLDKTDQDNEALESLTLQELALLGAYVQPL